MMGKHTAKRQAGEGVAYSVATPMGRQRLVFSNWPALAWLGYKRYLAAGRGAVCIVGAPLFGPANIGYAPIGANFGHPKLAAMAREYDPEREIVVIFYLEDSAITFRRYHVDNPAERPLEMYLRLLAEQGQRGEVTAN